MDRPGSIGTLSEAAPFRCPCCGLFTLEEEPPGTCLICPVCLWQDDAAQFEKPNMEATVNGVSLEQARLNYQEIAISDPQLRRYQRSGRAVRFSFHSHGTWAVANIADGRRGYIMVPCFLSDGLADLVDAVNQVFECGSGRCAWADEPGQWLWELIRKGDDVQIQILRFRNWHLGARLDPHCQTWMRDFQGVEFEMTCDGCTMEARYTHSLPNSRPFEAAESSMCIGATAKGATFNGRNADLASPFLPLVN